ncbi:MAG TPA: arylformamidase [Clostridiales bacterium]|nr:arylformamidase [Clostridiales bacterium]
MSEARIWDISLSLGPQTPVYPGLPGVEVVWMRHWSLGDTSAVSRLSFGTHVGTHVDAPLHFVQDGAGLDRIPLERFVGRARVVDLSGCPGPALTAGDLQQAGIAPPNELPDILLLRTRNSALLGEAQFRPDYVYLAPDAAETLVRCGVRTLGFDYLSVDPPKDPVKAAHRALLAAGVVLFEGLNLSVVPPGDYFFVGLPLRLEETEGAPARAILLELQEARKFGIDKTGKEVNGG